MHASRKRHGDRPSTPRPQAPRCSPVARGRCVMREPSDEAGRSAAGSMTPESPPRRPSPPGGKALSRLVQQLARAGLAADAQTVVRLALPGVAESAANGLVADATGGPAGDTATSLPGADGQGLSRLGAEYLAAAEALAAPAAAAGPTWRSLGPWTIPNGQTYGAGRVNVSGRVSAIVVDPTDVTHLLLGAANGGVWESRDKGVSWLPRTDNAATLTVGAIAFDPYDPAIVLVGTDEGNWWSWLGAGILRSTDRGTKWATLCTDPFVGQGFYDLVFDRTTRDRIYAATTGGLYVSTNGGSTWTRARPVTTWSISISSTEVLAACQDGLFRSTNGGATWVAVALPGGPGAFSRLATAIAPSDATVAYAWGALNGTAYLWRRAGGARTAVAPPPGVSTGQAWYDWFLAVAPDNSG